MMKYGILIDTGGAIFNDPDFKNTNIEIIPLRVVLEDMDFPDTPENLEKHNVFQKIRNNENITTSMASPGELEAKYLSMLEKYDHILHITITPNLSGMRDTAIMVANQDEFKEKVTILEHHTAANGIKYAALKLNKMINIDAVDSIKDFQKTMNEATDQIFLGLIPSDISKLNRGGRTKGILIKLLKIIKTKFLIRWGKKPKNIAMSRTLKALIEKAIKAADKYSGSEKRIILVKSAGMDESYFAQLKKALEFNNVEYVVELIPSIYACHAGADTSGIIAIPNSLL